MAASIDNVSTGVRQGWDDLKLWYETGGSQGSPPDFYLTRNIGAEDQPANRAENWGKRIGHLLYLQHREFAMRAME
jgi:hypothetical protein